MTQLPLLVFAGILAASHADILHPLPTASLADAVNRARPRHLPLEEGSTGPAVIRIQVLLDRSFDSPGVIDGRWSHNSQLAVQAFQVRSGLPSTGTLDYRTLQALLRDRRPAIAARVISRRDIGDRFVRIPEREDEQARMRCLCYESLSEKLGERFHVTPELLRKLNPKLNLGRLSVGDRILAPVTRRVRSTAVRVARVVVHERDGYLRALDRHGRVLLHFPATVGARYTRSPSGTSKVTKVTEFPTWRDEVNPGDEGIELPPGPNNPVGIVWIGLSKPGYGIHGTAAPERVGHSSSHGCVRLTNWDALLLAHSVRPGVTVEIVP